MVILFWGFMVQINIKNNPSSNVMREIEQLKQKGYFYEKEVRELSNHEFKETQELIQKMMAYAPNGEIMGFNDGKSLVIVQKKLKESQIDFEVFRYTGDPSQDKKLHELTKKV